MSGDEVAVGIFAIGLLFGVILNMALILASDD